MPASAPKTDIMDERRPSASGFARGRDLSARLLRVSGREWAVTLKERELAEREALLASRESALAARSEGNEAHSERDRLLGQVRDANGQLVLAIVAAQEHADEANAARQAADHNEARFRSLIATSSALVWQATADGDLVLDRSAWYRYTGLDIEPGAWAWLEAVHPGDRERVREAWREAVAHVTPYLCQHRIRNPEGGYAWVVAHAVPVPCTGAAREWIGMLTDITDRVRVEQAREQFIGILGHDLRNPLAAISMGVELLGDLPPPYAGVVQRIGRSAHRMEAMIRDVLDFARGRLAGGIPVTLKRCDLRVVCDQVVQEMRQAYPTKTITLDVAGDLCGELDQNRVEQVFSNLIGNAVTHGAGVIQVTAQAEGDEIVTTVRNGGRPIPAAVVATLFEPFTRDPEQVAGAGGKGLGLGLYIASEIVRAHRGSILVRSSEAEGTIFTVRWPRGAPTARPPRERASTQPCPPTDPCD